jgi:hypothetical protein
MGKTEPAVVHVRTSERRAFKRCPQRWAWAYLDGLRSKETAHALWFGSGIHEALAHYYQPGLKRAKDFVEVWESWCDDGSGDGQYAKVSELGDAYIEARELGVIMLLGHLAKWGEVDKKWDFIQSEMPFQVRIPLDDGTYIEYDGTFDGVYVDGNDRKKIKLLENKTAKAITRNHLSLDDQAGSYWAIAQTILKKRGVLKARQNIDGIQYNYLRKGIPDERPVNAAGYATNKPTKAHYAASVELQKAADMSEFKLGRLSADALAKLAEEHNIPIVGEVSKTQPAPLFERFYIKRTAPERRTQVQRIKDEALWMNSARNGELPIIKNPTMDCSWDCAFFAMCELHEQGVDWEDFRDQVFVSHDPYADHRKVA